MAGVAMGMSGFVFGILLAYVLDGWYKRREQKRERESSRTND